MSETNQDGVRILVIGNSNTGKTTIAQIIKSALDEHKFKNVTIHDSEEDTPGKQPIHLRIEATKARPVRIEVVQLNREDAKTLGFDAVGPVTGRLSSRKK